MLRELEIENIGIIEKVCLSPQKGLNVITGETGAGKSLIMSALDAVLGSRLTVGLVRNGAMRGIIRAVFSLVENGEEKEIVLKREISANGRSRMYVNGNLTTALRVREIAIKMIEMHGQHEHQRIMDAESHLDLLDAFAGCEDLCGNVVELYNQYRLLANHIRSASIEKEEREQRLDFLRFALDEIEQSNPQESEFENLQQEYTMIKNSGSLFQDLRNCYGMIRQDEGAILERLQVTVDTLERHLDIVPTLGEGVESMKEAYFLLETAADTVREQKESLDFSAERLQSVEDRLQQYQVLFKKYGATTKEVLERRDKYLSDLTSMEMSDEELKKASEEIKIVESQLVEKAKELSRMRRGSVFSLEKKLDIEMEQLGMSGAQIRVMLALTSVNQIPSDEQGDNSERFTIDSIHEKGFDRVEFFLAANQGEPLRSLRKIVSGGELSRISLALKNAICEKNRAGSMATCLVFDEIDAGVGGEVAHQIANRLKVLSQNHQLVVITHLHQIACVADNHFSVVKRQENGRTYATISHLTEEARLKEMTRILGNGSSEAAVRNHAKELLGIH